MWFYCESDEIGVIGSDWQYLKKILILREARCVYVEIVFGVCKFVCVCVIDLEVYSFLFQRKIN